MIRVRIGENIGVFVNCGNSFTGYYFVTINLWHIGFYFSTRSTKKYGSSNDGWFIGKVFIGRK